MTKENSNNEKNNEHKTTLGSDAERSELDAMLDIDMPKAPVNTRAVKFNI